MSMTVLNRLQQIEDVVRSADDEVDAVEVTGLRARWAAGPCPTRLGT